MFFTAVCLCGCLMGCLGLPQSGPITLNTGVSIILKAYYGSDTSPETDRLIRHELKDFKWDILKSKSITESEKIIIHYFKSVYLKRVAAKQNVIHQLSEQLKIKPEDSRFITDDVRNRIASKIPPEILSRLDKSNGRVQREEKKEIMMIGKKTRSCALDWKKKSPIACINFGPLADNFRDHEVVKAQIALHIRDKAPFLQSKLQVRQITRVHGVQIPGAPLGKPVAVPFDYKEIILDVSRDVNRWLRQSSIQKSTERTYMIECDDLGFCPDAELDIDNAILEVTVKIPLEENIRRRLKRAPFENSKKTPSTKTSKSTNKQEVSEYCRNGLFENNRCCLMNFTIFLQELWTNIIEPKTLQIDYCTGACSAYSPPKNTHSHIIQKLIHGQRHAVLEENRKDLSLCCAPREYKNFNILYVEKNDISRPSLLLVTDVAAKSCACA